MQFIPFVINFNIFHRNYDFEFKVAVSCVLLTQMYIN